MTSAGWYVRSNVASAETRSPFTHALGAAAGGSSVEVGVAAAAAGASRSPAPPGAIFAPAPASGGARASFAVTAGAGASPAPFASTAGSTAGGISASDAVMAAAPRARGSAATSISEDDSHSFDRHNPG